MVNSENFNNWFSRYNDIRLKDIKGLSKIVTYLNESDSLSSAKKGSRGMFMLIQAMLKGLGVFKHTYEDLTFGQRSVERIPYSEIADLFEGRQRYIMPISRLIFYPIYYAFSSD